ncbi:tyrosine-protein phosphatase [Senegalia massiliensis]|uniref:tyrosine-protein phosphatase n=1 Tax=Senegalia massiliensis TaxID=1720316 RepID=UPI0010315945|nr:CpsB/CapC family capsule biosynthesis tyrosine phosphatase [Senegalia massiliensis]
MIDIHSHILPFVDDGSRDMETSIEMAKIAAEEGIKYIFATSHYIENEGYNDKKSNKEILDKLNKEILEQNIDIKVLLGHEVYITPNIIDLIEDEKISLLGNSDYLLMELPMAQIPIYLEDIIYELKLKGVTPIIAHPERYREVKKNPNILRKFIELGALMQVNLGSLIGYYGEDIAKTSKILVSHNMIHFVGTDSHSLNRRPPRAKQAIKVLNEILPKEKVIDLIENNPMNIVNNIEIEASETMEYKEKKGFKSIFQNMFKK